MLCFKYLLNFPKFFLVIIFFMLDGANSQDYIFFSLTIRQHHHLSLSDHGTGRKNKFAADMEEYTL